MVDHVGVQVISAAHGGWIFPFTGLQPAQFRRLVRLVAERGGEAIADGRPGRQWSLDLADRVLLVAAYWRTARVEGGPEQMTPTPPTGNAFIELRDIV